MIVDYNKLSELLNVFGLSLYLENGNAVFVDVETNTPMKSYVVYNERFADQEVEYTTEANKLLDGWPFYVDTENKHFRLKIFVRDENFKVSEITKTERKEPHLYESSELKINRRQYTLGETTYRRHTREDGSEYLSCDLISNVMFGANEITDVREGEIEIHTDKKSADICFKKDVATGEIIPGYEDFEEISQQEATQLIEQSRVFKDIMRILYPTLAESYSNAKTNSVGPTK